MAGLGRKTFNSGDVLNAADVQGYLMDQAVRVFDGTASRGSAIPTPSAGMVAYSTATQLQVYDGSAWVDLSTGYGVATGGSSSSITVGGINYTLETFTSDGTLTVSKAGLFDVLLLSGAGSGAGGASAFASLGSGGGGAGGLLISTVYLDATTYTVDVGAGGAGGAVDTVAANFGAKSSLGTLLSVAGGGAGGGPAGAAGTLQRNFILLGGSNGGGARQATNVPSTTIDQNVGKIGGAGATDAAGGGGGYSVAGANAVTNTGGAGGNGYDQSAFIGGSASYIATGGGGGGSTAGGAGGNSSANSNAGKTSGTGNTATANTGSGGGGTCGNAAGGAGSSGIVYVRFKS